MPLLSGHYRSGVCTGCSVSSSITTLLATLFFLFFSFFFFLSCNLLKTKQYLLLTLIISCILYVAPNNSIFSLPCLTLSRNSCENDKNNKRKKQKYVFASYILSIISWPYTCCDSLNVNLKIQNQ